MVYLNDVTDGGGTDFPTLDYKMDARVGDFSIWPAYWTHPHRGRSYLQQKQSIL